MTQIAQTPFHEDPLEFDLATLEDGTKTAVNLVLSIAVLPDGEAKIFKRRAIKLGAGNSAYKTALVCELNGVRVYIQNNQLVMTTQDLNL